MQNIKKMSLFICSLLLVIFTGLFFVGCKGSIYDNVSLSATINGENTTSVALDKGEDVAIVFTMHGYSDKMNGELEITPVFDTIDCFTYQVNYNGNGVTTVVVTGNKGGKAHLHAATIDGAKSCDVEIKVNEFSDTLESNESNLYVTESTALIPTATDFSFNDDATVRELEYYFYGIASKEGRDLTIEDIKDTTGTLSQKFNSISLIKNQANGENYLLFDDGSGNFYTLQDANEDEHKNVRLVFIRVEKYDGGYNFFGNPKVVQLGDRFTFVARYVNNLNQEIIAQRDFYVLKDLNGNQISYSYQYNSSSQKPNVYTRNDIILIPNKFEIANNNYVDYKALTLTIELPTDSDLVHMDYDIPEVEGIKVVNIVKNQPNIGEGKTTYNLNIANNSLTSVNSMFNLYFYYSGFKDSIDENVNYKLSIPLNIIYEPENIIVNNDTDGINKYVFYNNYADTNVGWQRFDVSYAPNDAAFTNYTIKFDPTQVRMMYRGETAPYTSGEVVLNELREPLYFKGVNGEENLVEEGLINITLNYTILEDKTLEYNIPYSVIQGAKQIFFDDIEHESDGVFIALNKDYQTFTGLYTTTYFSNVTCVPTNKEAGEAVDVKFKGMKEENGKFKISLNVKGLKINELTNGRVTWNIILDNGTTLPVSFVVLESLDTVTAQVENETGSVANVVTVDQVGEVGDDDYAPATTTLYIRNKNNDQGAVYGERVVVNLLGNGNEKSTAITNTSYSRFGAGFSVVDYRNQKVVVNITTNSAGEGGIIYNLIGYTVNENFKRVSVTITYNINLVSYSLIETLNIIKTHDGHGDYSLSNNISAGNVTVYYGTNNTSLKSATFDVSPKYAGYYFFNPISANVEDVNNMENYEKTAFDRKYVYWRANSIIRKNGILVEDGVMVYDDTEGAVNRYTIEGFGIFDTSTMTFEAFNYKFSTQLVATVRQFDRPYSFTITINSEEYMDVSNLSLQDKDENDDLTFTATESKRTKHIVIYTNPRNATNPSVKVVFEAPVVTVDGESVTADMFGAVDSNGEYEGISIVNNGNGVFSVTLTISQEFINQYATYGSDSLQGRLIFASADWISGSSVLPDYSPYCVNINVSFANGTRENPYALETPQDVLDINDMPSAHYKLSTTIDMSMIKNSVLQSSLPIEGFSGSIIGYTAQAQIIGINITDENIDSTSGYFGLFGKLERTAQINGVKFKGSINVTLTKELVNVNLITPHIGLIAGLNEGELINVGVELTRESVIELAFDNLIEQENFYVGGVVGRNVGKILQDYRMYSNESYNQFGQTPNILIYGGENKFIIKRADTIYSNRNANLYVGAVTGYNSTSGSIEKYDNDNLKTSGYTDYLAYLNIVVSGNSKNYIGMIAGHSFGIIRGRATDGSFYLPIGSTDNGTVYEAGKGIVVGGSIRDESFLTTTDRWDSIVQFVGGAVGRLGVNNANDSEKVTIGGSFTGITSRVSVLGTRHVGAITGFSYAENDSTNKAFAIQAVDNGETGYNASMITKVYSNIDSTFVNNFGSNTNNNVNFFAITEDTNADSKTGYIVDYDYIAFGSFGSTAFNFMTEKNVFSYVNRQLYSGHVASPDTQHYYGDFVITTSLDSSNGFNYAKPNYVKTQYVYGEFAKDTQSMSVSANQGFNRFALRRFNEDLGEYEYIESNDIFYSYYFGSNGFIYQEEGDNDITESQNYLDSRFNSLAPESKLYPINISRGLELTSLTTDILTFDQSGKITVQKTGLAQVKLSSLLDKNSALYFYIYVVDYFNPDNNVSIIYPTTSNATVAIDESIVEIKGDSTLTLYVRPTNNGKLSISDDALINIENGILLDNGANIELDTNQIISSNLRIYRQTGSGEICVYDSTGDIEVATKELNVTINGQTITLNHNSKTLEYIDSNNGVKYRLEITPTIKVKFDNNVNDLTDDEVYVCDINKKLENVDLRYLKGAKSIRTMNYSTLSLTTVNEALDEVIVVSTRTESEPQYVIERDGHALFSTYEGVQLDESDEVFIINLIPKDTGTFVEGSDELKTYSWNMSIKFNTNSQTYLNRYEPGIDIYGEYTLVLYSSTDPSKFKTVTITLEQTFVERITIDNYSDINKTDIDFSSTSGIGIPGKSGLIAITLTPQDCDFDYITIENDALADEAGNGVANFSLVSRPESGAFEFNETAISGNVTNKGVRFSLADIIKAYDVEGVDSYKGIVFIRYHIGTKGVASNGKAKFNVIVSNGTDEPKTESIYLDLELEFHANVDVVGKTPIESTDQSVHAVYQVASGLRYELSLEDIWGFSKENVELSLSNTSYASIEEEEGKYYLQIAKNITYSGDFAEFNIVARARQKDGEIERDVTSSTKIQVLDYVLNYNYELAGNADIVREMDEGVINVRIGNKHSLLVDLYDYVEYDSTNASIVTRVEAFYKDLTVNGSWSLYTNLYRNGASSNNTITTQDYESKEALESDKTFTNIYLTASGFNIVPKRTHNPNIPYYLFSYEGAFTISNGGYIACSNSVIGAQRVYTEFAINCFQSSSAESPIPVDNYEDFVEMQATANYILTSDIIIPNTDSSVQTPFAPISTAIASLDGNDYKIIFAGNYDFGDEEYLGLFSEISTETILKNITIELTADVTFKSSSDGALNVGLLAGANNGVITNCNIIGGENQELGQTFYFRVSSPNLESQTFIAGLVGTNSGNITHSRSSVNIITSFNASGLVGVNNGKISSCYFKNGYIKGEGTGFATAGLVVVNRGDAQTSDDGETSANTRGIIMNSYVSGEPDVNYIFSRDETHILTAEGLQAGFAYSNTGLIKDCYSNIQIQGSSTMAGFVHDNAGEILNSFSLSVLQDNVTSSAGFVMNNQIKTLATVGNLEDNQVGTFENCFYFVNTQKDINSNKGYSASTGVGSINESIVPKNFEGVKALNRSQFSAESPDFEENFGSYAVYDLNNINSNSVWFYSKANATSSTFNNAIFNGERLELVSANVIASSRRILAEDRVETDVSGEVHYSYDYDLNYPALGSVNNPYIVRDASELENYMEEGKTSTGYNFKHYRIVNDIDYSIYPEPSSLYEISFCGTIEGNGMNIRNIILASASKLESAGMFARIGRDTTTIGVVMNMDIYPASDIAFTNASLVGGLTGLLSNGYIFNVNITRDGEVINVAGSNFVGGLVGMAQDRYLIFNSSSDLSAVANYMPPDDNLGSYEATSFANSEYSYAGGLIGYATGRNAYIKNIELNNIRTVMGSRAGLAFGGLGRNVSVYSLVVRPNTETLIRAYEYGGLVAGEVRGTMDLVRVQTSGGDLSPFELIPSVPTAVGGVTGLLQGGSLNRIDMQQMFSAPSLAVSSEKEAIKIANVGGVVGVSEGTVNLNQVVVHNDISASQTLGGVIGLVNSGYVEMKETAVKSSSLEVTGYNTSSQLAGFIGYANNGTIINISDSYCLADLSLHCYSYSTGITADVGGFVGNNNVNKMTRCFFTGKVDVTLEDKRSSEAVAVVTSNTNDPHKIFSDKIKPSGSGNLSSESGNIVDVYYLGANTVDKPTIDDFGEYLTYKSNASTANSTLNYSMVGMSTAMYANGLTGKEMLAATGDIKVLYNLFDYYQYNWTKIEGSSHTSNKEELYFDGVDKFYTVGFDKNASGYKCYNFDKNTNLYIVTNSALWKDKNGDGQITEDDRPTTEQGGISFFKSSLSDVSEDNNRGHYNLRSVWTPGGEGLSYLTFEDEMVSWF